MTRQGWGEQVEAAFERATDQNSVPAASYWVRRRREQPYAGDPRRDVPMQVVRN